jgi:hypothetical protein
VEVGGMSDSCEGGPDVQYAPRRTRSFRNILLVRGMASVCFVLPLIPFSFIPFELTDQNVEIFTTVKKSRRVGVEGGCALSHSGV